MKANDFIKKFGLSVAKFCILNCACSNDRWFIHSNTLIDAEDFDDLKRLVESHELVKEHGNLERAKEYANSPYTAPEVKERLKQAIADVESCMEVANENISNHN